MSADMTRHAPGPSLATSQRRIADPVLLVLAAMVAIFAGVAAASAFGQVVTVSAYFGATAIMTALFVAMRRLELSFWAIVPLLTIVRVEPAPVDLMIVALLLAMLARGQLFRRAPPPVLLLSSALLILSNIVALIFAGELQAGLAHAIITLHLIAFALVSYQLALRGSRDAEGAYVAASIGLALMTIAAYLPLGFADLFRYDSARVEGLFKDPNVFGPFVIPAIALVMLRDSPRYLAVRIALMTLFVLPIAASASRGAFLALVAAIAVVAVVAFYRGWRFAWAPAAGAAAVSAMIFAVVAVGGGDSPHALLQEQSYDVDRFAAQDAGLAYLANSPLTPGLGPANAQDVLGTANPIHETYVRIAVETGLLGLMGLLLLIWITLAAVRVDRPEAVAWVAAFFGFLVVGFFIDTFHWRHLWLAAGIACAYGSSAASARRFAQVRLPGMSRVSRKRSP